MTHSVSQPRCDSKLTVTNLLGPLNEQSSPWHWMLFCWMASTARRPVGVLYLYWLLPPWWAAGAQKSNQQRDRTEGKSGRPSSSALIMMKPGENRLQTKQTAFFSTRVGHIQIFLDGLASYLFTWQVCGETNGQSVEDDDEESSGALGGLCTRLARIYVHIKLIQPTRTVFFFVFGVHVTTAETAQIRRKMGLAAANLPII